VRSVALGVASPHVIDVASAYATFADRGQHVDPTVITKVTGPNGGVLLAITPTPQQAFTPDVADTVNFALQKVVTDGTGFRAQALGRPAAGKTGTTNQNLSAWFVGYTPDLAAAVMFVKDGPDGKPVTLSGVGGLNSVTGGSFPAKVWTAFMQGALANTPVSDFVAPSSQPTGGASASTSASSSPSVSASSPSASPSTSPTLSPSATASPSGSSPSASSSSSSPSASSSVSASLSPDVSPSVAPKAAPSP
jgi:membrane peptidoglycan carboxypeptidase